MSVPQQNHDLGDRAAAKAELLAHAKFELIPMKTTLEKARLLPAETRVSVTASAAKDITATVETSEELSRMGLSVVPHLSARLIRGRAELGEIAERLSAAGIEELFVIGGDGEQSGEFSDAFALIEALTDLGNPFERLGIAGYPEGHPFISNEVLTQALIAKAPHASYVTTQMCFDAAAIERWVRTIRERGVTLPVVVGIPGVTDAAKLMAISARIGVGKSLRFLSKNRGLAGRLIRPYSPDTLVDSIAEIACDQSLGIVGLHVYTFNQVAATLEWFRKAQA